jgi:hypothetical protein
MGNQPDHPIMDKTSDIQVLTSGDITAIGQACGNGWRKVFNVYAKFYFGWKSQTTALSSYHNWQEYRDNQLLQAASNTLLLFSYPQLKEAQGVNIIMGRTYAKSLSLPASVVWLNDEFAVDTESRIVVCPYFDYRQLSNIKIIYLVNLLNEYFPELIDID